MKIAFIAHGDFAKHATLKRATGMAHPLMEEGHDVAIVLEDTMHNREKVALECPEAQIFWYAHAKSYISEQRSKQKYINAWQPDLVWICGLGPRNWIFKPKGKCLIFCDHSELYSAFSKGAIKRKAYHCLEVLSCRYFDGQICASRYLENHFTNLLTKWKLPVRVHYSPYAYHRLVGSVPEDSRLSRIDRYNGKRVLLYMGSFWENYGFWDILKAFKLLNDTRSDFVAILIGRGPEKQRAIEWVNEQNLVSVIHIEGYVEEEDLPGYFSIAHAFMCPLRDTVQDWARCPSKLYMYIPFGRPVVTCAIGEAKELFGDSGCYYEPGNVESLVTVLGQVLDGRGVGAVDPKMHDYHARTSTFLEWLYANFCFSRS